MTVAIHPARANQGITLVRSDLSGSPSCPANTEHVNAISFRTNLSCGEASFTMVEHLLSALAGLEIDNAIVEVSAQELPGLDGSAKAFVDALQQAGLIIQAATKPRLIIQERIRIGDQNGWVEATPPKQNESHFEYQLCYGKESPIPTADFGIDITPHSYAHQIASARTFVTADQADQLRASGVAGHVTNQDLIVFDENGPVENTLRFSDECTRHKLLDMVGDLSLTGLEIIGRVRSNRGGHMTNSALARKLCELAASRQSVQPSLRRIA